MGLFDDPPPQSPYYVSLIKLLQQTWFSSLDHKLFVIKTKVFEKPAKLEDSTVSYGVDLCFTPMILADSFCQNAKARSSEFSTTANDCPLIVQFAANNVEDFVDSAKLVYPYGDGVDLNCGCPQRWAMKDGYGCAMLSKPEIIYEIVKGVRNSLPSPFSVSVKIRILKDLKKTIELCKQLEMCGVSFLTVHGRTPAQKSTGNVDTAALRRVCDCIGLPVVANGGVRTLDDADELFNTVNCSGVMAASGLLTNPALFSGTSRTPLSCVKFWKNLKDKDTDRITFQCYHHHLVFMLEKILSKSEKQIFNSLSSFESVDKYVNENVINSVDSNLEHQYSMGDFVSCQYPEEITTKHSSKCRSCGKSAYYCICSKYDYNESDGRFFITHLQDNDALDYMDSNIFDRLT